MCVCVPLCVCELATSERERLRENCELMIERIPTYLMREKDKE